MKFKRQFLADMGGETVLDEITSHSRWSVHHRRVFKADGLFYETSYSVGATESQDESPYEYEPEEIECAEVVPVSRTVTVYERVKS